MTSEPSSAHEQWTGYTLGFLCDLLNEEVLQGFACEPRQFLSYFFQIGHALLAGYRRRAVVFLGPAGGLSLLLAQRTSEALAADAQTSMPFAIEHFIKVRLPGRCSGWHVERGCSDLLTKAQGMFACMLVAEAFVGGQTGKALQRLLRSHEQVNEGSPGSEAVAGLELAWSQWRLVRAPGFSRPTRRVLLGEPPKSGAFLLPLDFRPVEALSRRFVRDRLTRGCEKHLIGLPEALSGISSAMPQKHFRRWSVFVGVRHTSALAPWIWFWRSVIHRVHVWLSLQERGIVP